MRLHFWHCFFIAVARSKDTLEYVDRTGLAYTAG
jgi:hypothetical protein